jgi:hypothetical protein
MERIEIRITDAPCRQVARTCSLTERCHGAQTDKTILNRQSSIFLISVSLDGVRLSPLGTSATVGLLYQPRMIDDDDYGAVGRMRTGRGNRSTGRKPAPVPLYPPQIPHDLTWDRTRAAAVRSQRLTAWAMSRPNRLSNSHSFANSAKKWYLPTIFCQFNLYQLLLWILFFSGT